jgi:gamma-glutamyltranspeptidase/glutathione hydrolase
MKARQSLAAGWSHAASALIAAIVASAVGAQPAQPVRATTQLVVAANPHAAEAGIAILRAGGGAVDAAIAVQLVLTMVEPQSSGIGGGAFMLVHAAGEGRRSATITAYEGRETAPAAATPDMFLNSNGRAESFGNVGVGGLAVGVPGALRMLEIAHREHGRLPWAELFAPAIQVAEQGFDVSPRLHSLLDGFKRFARGEDFRRYYYDASGEPHAVGYRLTNPEYAATLRMLAANGAEPMYSGELAAAIAAEVQGNNVRPGRMTMQDLARYDARESVPLCTAYRAWRVCGPRLPQRAEAASLMDVPESERTSLK